MSSAPIDSLCEALVQELRRDPRGPGVIRLLSDYARDHDDWRPWARFSEERYTRNLVHRCEEFELLLLCWEAGQESPIHDHSGQHCWMAVLDGDLEELHFRTDPGGGLRTGRRGAYTPGQVAYIQDDIALHLVRPRHDARGVSLHLYAQPIDDCRIFCPDTGTTEHVAMGYHSVRGELCEEPAEAVRARYCE